MKKHSILRTVFLASVCLLIILGICSCNTTQEDAASTEAKYFKVTFNSLGGSEVSEQRVLENEKISCPDAPVRDGYVFEHWEHAGKEWSFSYDKVTEDITLVASWIDASQVYEHRQADGINGKYITGCKQFFASMPIPSAIDGIPVIGIDDGAFADVDSETVQKIILPSSVTAIGNNAFKGCADIEIVVNGALTLIGESAFEGCSGLSAIKLGNELDNLPFNAFKECTALKHVVLPSSLTLISENAFEDCSSLAYIVMHSNTVTVEDNAFGGCTNLKTVYYHGTQAQLDEISIATSNSPLTDANYFFYSKDEPAEAGAYWRYDENGKIKLWT